MPFCGSDIPSTSESASDMFSAMYDYYPGLAKIYRDQLVPTALAEQQASQAVSPAYQQLMTDLYRQYGPANAAIGQGIDASNRLASANTDVNILKGPGTELAKTYQDIEKQLNPEYYATRAATSGKIDELLNSINLGNANPEAERLISQENARSGNLGTPSASNTVANALSFGDAANSRRAALSTAINAATNFLQPSSSASAFNPATTALNRPTSNTGASQFAGVQQGAGAAGQQAAQGFTDQLSQIQQGYNSNMANRRDVVDRINEGFSSL
jgi:hypothetical protein